MWLSSFPDFLVSPPHTLPLPDYQQFTSRKKNKEPVAIHIPPDQYPALPASRDFFMWAERLRNGGE